MDIEGPELIISSRRSQANREGEGIMNEVRSLVSVAVGLFLAASAQSALAGHAIGNRAGSISRSIIGTWVRRDEQGHKLRMQVLPNGIVRNHYFNYGTKTMADRTEPWVVDQNGLTLDNIATEVRFSGRKMTLTSQPASATIVEHWIKGN